MSQSEIDDSVFEDATFTPPTTDAKTGTWDDSGSIRGFSFRSRENRNRILDFVLEDRWTERGLTCLLVRITEYFEHGRLTRGPSRYSEWETYYRGYVHAPGVESFPKGYCNTYIVDCYPDDGWFCWDERSWSNRRGYGESMRESALRKTNRLAEGLDLRERGKL
ncbi:hypothetical protein [Natronosalvus amylolyticus]|uniref:hypothetical protein n=1 Tax=Natronosalvus amylolyticus TaxID=2961994 RepID=UPI0020CA17ED|nr:hypothetical protein [Natronosalvus amylolyticus]